MSVATGHFATLSVDDSAVALCRSIGGWSETKPVVDASHLETPGPGRDYIPADLGDAEPWEVECLFDADVAADPGPLLDLTSGAPVNVVIQYRPTNPANAVGSKWTGTGFVTSRTAPTALTNEVMTCTYQIQWAATPTWEQEVVGP